MIGNQRDDKRALNYELKYPSGDILNGGWSGETS